MEHAWGPQSLGEGGRPGALRPAAGQEQDAHGIDGMWKQQNSDPVLIISRHSLYPAENVEENLAVSLDCNEIIGKSIRSRLIQPLMMS